MKNIFEKLFFNKIIDKLNEIDTKDYRKEDYVKTILNLIGETLLNPSISNSCKKDNLQAIALKLDNPFHLPIVLKAIEKLEKIWQKESKKNWIFDCNKDDKEHKVKKCVQCFIDQEIEEEIKKNKLLH